MRHFIVIAGTCIALAAGLSVARAEAPVCLRGIDIDQTEIKSDKLILFHMRSGQIYRNDLPFDCPTLASSINGITYEPTDPATDELCDNLGVFKVNDGASEARLGEGGLGHGGLGGLGNGITCEWGKFTRVK